MSKSKIYEAVKLLKETCEENSEYCIFCPLFDEDEEDCRVAPYNSTEHSPATWKIINERDFINGEE